MHEALYQAREKYRDPVDRCLEQDWLNQWRAIEEPKERHRIRGDHGFADHEGRHGSEHEIADRDGVVGDEEVRRQYNEIEADEKEDCWDQCLPEFMQYAGADTSPEWSGCAGPCCRR